MVDIKISLEELDHDLSLGIDELTEDVPFTFGDVQEITTSDYQKLINKPTINAGYPIYAKELVDNYDEVDPTVPDWAKNATPPSASDIGAVDEDDIVTFGAIDTMITSIFG